MGGRFGDLPPLRQAVRHPGVLKEFKIDFGRGCASLQGLTLVGKHVRDVGEQDHVQAVLRDAAWMMVVSHGFDDGVRESPKAEQVRADLRMRDVNQLFLNFEERPALVLCLCNGTGKVRGGTLGDDVLPHVVKQGSKDGGGLKARRVGNAGRDASGELRVALEGFEEFDGDEFIAGEGAENLERENEIVKDGDAEATDRRLKIGNVAGKAKKGGIHELKKLCAERSVLLDDLGDTLDGDVWLNESLF